MKKKDEIYTFEYIDTGDVSNDLLFSEFMGKLSYLGLIERFALEGNSIRMRLNVAVTKKELKKIKKRDMALEKTHKEVSDHMDTFDAQHDDEPFEEQPLPPRRRRRGLDSIPKKKKKNKIFTVNYTKAKGIFEENNFVEFIELLEYLGLIIKRSTFDGRTSFELTVAVTKKQLKKASKRTKSFEKGSAKFDQWLERIADKTLQPVLKPSSKPRSK